MLATATHDHKRGEDVRMRLAVLSEIPDEWAAVLNDWMADSAGLRADLASGPAPEDGDAVMLFQMLVASWPLGLPADDAAGIAAWAERVAGWQQKAMREAKRRTGWAMPDEDYETASRAFLDGVLSPANGSLLADIADFAARIAAPGALKSLAQTVLRLTTPGVPDLYQGTEYWDESLVDPDNRRPVDFDNRQAALGEASPNEAMPEWRDGRVKQAVIHRLLQLRAEWPALFLDGDYQPVEATGPLAGAVLAFQRQHEGRQMMVIVPLRSASLMGDAAMPSFLSGRWFGTQLPLPAGKGDWLCALNDRVVQQTETLDLDMLADGIPALVLVREQRVH
jgi:(1->4)-alpha-D-glucan 1-alpha-D-glucosylmutase